jgi:hypothetical protein
MTLEVLNTAQAITSVETEVNSLRDRVSPTVEETPREPYSTVP